jgi:Tripartite tricarboxylate transporter TctB family
MRIAVKDLSAGLVFAGFGAAFTIGAMGYDMGTARQMGPGYFPAVLGALLTVLGGLLIVGSFGRADETPVTRPAWRGMGLILGALFFFGLGVHQIGLAPAIFVTAILSGLASDEASLREVVILAFGLTALCVLIFVYGLGAGVPLFGPLLGM